ncbi:hypothetical protein [Geodermatophilus sabuli]|uniref:Uncharacterized protein n=1 Tax=Geodermatophilus sabuli TaxID=1564158 RepID=A0A285EBD5_9ACTN|nr:hypothetical protein [Geodermatophilus sabuli]MBB3084377.1 hypothetical protein [Geodermatophilus sabuli]SNX96355.1 hypothetical protein SAMN06893097_10469 [Geodermatophilus sabuli]
MTTTEMFPVQLRSDFAQACSDLAEARSRQRRKDSPGNRGAVRECWTSIDRVLDAYLDSR